MKFPTPPFRFLAPQHTSDPHIVFVHSFSIVHLTVHPCLSACTQDPVSKWVSRYIYFLNKPKIGRLDYSASIRAENMTENRPTEEG